MFVFFLCFLFFFFFWKFVIRLIGIDCREEKKRKIKEYWYNLMFWLFFHFQSKSLSKKKKQQNNNNWWWSPRTIDWLTSMCGYVSNDLSWWSLLIIKMIKNLRKSWSFQSNVILLHRSKLKKLQRARERRKLSLITIWHYPLLSNQKWLIKMEWKAKKKKWWKSKSIKSFSSKKKKKSFLSSLSRSNSIEFKDIVILIINNIESLEIETKQKREKKKSGK